MACLDFSSKVVLTYYSLAIFCIRLILVIVVKVAYW
jgi:hypothetical protein